MECEECIELYGIIISVNRNKNEFVVHTKNQGHNYKCTYLQFCPVDVGDSIHAFGTLDHDLKFTIITAPFITISRNKDILLQNMSRIFKSTNIATKLYNLFENNGIRDLLCSSTSCTNHNIVIDQTIAYISKIACIWNDSGDDTIFNIFEEVIKKSKIRPFFIWWIKQRELRQLYLLGLNNGEITEIKTFFGLSFQAMYDQCIKNPYLLAPLSLDKCDQILLRLNQEPCIQHRECGIIIRTIYKYMKNKGWMGMPTRVIKSLCPNITTYIEILRNDYQISTDLHTIYLSYPYKVELYVTNKIVSLLNKKVNFHNTITFNRNTLSDLQKESVVKSLNSGISQIVGPAGSGKTTVISEIVYNLEHYKIPYQVASFTGKAVARIREVINRTTPSTLHRLMATKEPAHFMYLLIDESSMITTPVFYEFLRKFDYDYNIIFIGDINQLEPIGYGFLFEQLISSGKIPTITLDTIYRTNNNGIISNANKIVEYAHSDQPELFEFVSDDYFTLIDGSIEEVITIITQLHKINIPYESIIIISPYNNELDRLNQICQDIYYPDKKFITDRNGKKWKIMDKVMLIDNRYDINVMNGDEGIIKDVSDCDINVAFKDGSCHSFKVDYQSSNTPKTMMGIGIKDTEELTCKLLCHSYAITVHRCVAPNTLISTNYGLIPIDLLYQQMVGNSESLYCSIPSNRLRIHGYHEVNPCIGMYRGMVEPSIKITSSCGIYLEGSYRHLVLINRHNCLIWVRLSQLHYGDHIIIHGTPLPSYTYLLYLKYLISVFPTHYYINSAYPLHNVQLILLHFGIISQCSNIGSRWILQLGEIEELKLRRLLRTKWFKDDYRIFKMNSITLYNPIIKIEYNQCQMYDLDVKSYRHSIITNGMVTHNSQGSEWDYVIFYCPCNLSNGRFVNRKLLYTAITRAKHNIWCVGDPSTLNASATRSTGYKCDNLAEQIKLLLNKN